MLAGDGGSPEAFCWGNDYYYQVSHTPIAPLATLDGGGFHTCALQLADHEPYCWGDDYYGQLSGAPLEPFDSISSGYDFTCGIRSSDRTLTCWGDRVFNPR